MSLRTHFSLSFLRSVFSFTVCLFSIFQCSSPVPETPIETLPETPKEENSQAVKYIRKTDTLCFAWKGYRTLESRPVVEEKNVRTEVMNLVIYAMIDEEGRYRELSETVNVIQEEIPTLMFIRMETGMSLFMDVRAMPIRYEVTPEEDCLMIMCDYMTRKEVAE